MNNSTLLYAIFNNNVNINLFNLINYFHDQLYNYYSTSRSCINSCQEFMNMHDHLCNAIDHLAESNKHTSLLMNITNTNEKLFFDHFHSLHNIFQICFEDLFQFHNFFHDYIPNKDHSHSLYNLYNFSTIGLQTLDMLFHNYTQCFHSMYLFFHSQTNSTVGVYTQSILSNYYQILDELNSTLYQIQFHLHILSNWYHNHQYQILQHQDIEKFHIYLRTIHDQLNVLKKTFDKLFTILVQDI
jgi:hypothetical protein